MPDLSKEEKWQWIASEMKSIQMAETAFNLRRRYNPHHPKDDVAKETRVIRTEQYAKWLKVKDFYAENRDELSNNTFESEDFASCRNILERIFTQEVDDALRQNLGE